MALPFMVVTVIVLFIATVPTLTNIPVPNVAVVPVTPGIKLTWKLNPNRLAAVCPLAIVKLAVPSTPVTAVLLALVVNDGIIEIPSQVVPAKVLVGLIVNLTVETGAEAIPTADSVFVAPNWVSPVVKTWGEEVAKVILVVSPESAIFATKSLLVELTLTVASADAVSQS